VADHHLECGVALGLGQSEDLATEAKAVGSNALPDQVVDLAAEVVPAKVVVLAHRRHEDRDDSME
jgi:hypothetical protein